MKNILLVTQNHVIDTCVTLTNIYNIEQVCESKGWSNTERNNIISILLVQHWAIERSNNFHNQSEIAAKQLTELNSNYWWWFQTFFIFHNIWDNFSHWLSYFSRWFFNHQPAIIDPFFMVKLVTPPFFIGKQQDGYWWISKGLKAFSFHRLRSA